MKGKEKNMSEIRNIVHRLRLGQSIRQIHRELGAYRPIIRDLNNLAIAHQWLNPELAMPSNEEIASIWEKQIKTQPHPLDIFKEQLEQWNKEGLSSIVIQQLLKERCSCDVQSIRRYRKKHFPKQIEPVMVRSTSAGRDMDLDFRDFGKFLADDGTLKRVWLFSYGYVIQDVHTERSFLIKPSQHFLWDMFMLLNILTEYPKLASWIT